MLFTPNWIFGPVCSQVSWLEVLRQNTAAGMHYSAQSGSSDRVVLVSLGDDGIGADCCYESLCRGWRFTLEGCGKGGAAVSVWAQQEAITLRQLKPTSHISAQRVVIGRFEDRCSFGQSFLVADQSITLEFSEQGRVHIWVHDRWDATDRRFCIRVSVRELSTFSLVCRKPRCATFYLSLNSTPVVSVTSENDEQERLTGYHHHPLLTALASDFVLAVTVETAQASIWQNLWHETVKSTQLFDSVIAHQQPLAGTGFELTKPMPRDHPQARAVSECQWALGVMATSCTALPKRHLISIVSQCQKIVDKYSPSTEEPQKTTVTRRV